MKLLRSWLQDWIDLTDIDDTDLSTALESLGFEIEDYKLINPDYKNIIVGKVIEIYPHPNADKVRVTKVDVGNKIYEIVCGAWNFEEGAIVPVALPNSYIKDSFKIDKRDIRGVDARIPNEMQMKGKETLQILAESNERLASMYIKTEKPEVAVPLLVETIRIMSPNSQKVKKLMKD